MSIREIRLPALSATMEEATLLSWLVSPGDAVTEGQSIAEVSTDKVDMDLEAPFAGTIGELLAEPGATVALGAVLATVETESDDLLGGLALGAEPSGPESPAVTTDAPTETSAATEPATARAGGIVPASPPARKLARELGIDLAAVTPTGRRGQVTPTDVRAHAGERSARKTTPTAPSVTPTATAPPAAPAASRLSGDEAKQLSVRRATADIMGRSATIPQFTLWRTLVLDRAAGRKNGRSWTTELVRALSAALRERPELNRRWDEDERTTIPFEGIRVGLAVDRPGTGLVVAAIADPDLGDPAEADRTVRAVADRARTGKLRPEDMAQASITLSNLGGFGVDRFNALLFPPQAAILSVGSIAMRPVATGDGALKSALTCEVGLTVDHRVGDGADGARFLSTFAELVEHGD
jgi:pyruvate dehydrogenase E2 component (dihydrolipoamide acetyltransferase)